MITRNIIALLNVARTLGSPVMLGLTLLFYAVYAQAGQVSLAWNASTGSNVGGYLVYYGQASHNYNANVDAGNHTSYTVAGLQDGKTYYFAVKAYNTARTIQSALSNEVSTTTATPSTSTATSSTTTATSSTAPKANFDASPSSGTAPLTVTFTNTSTGTVTAYCWKFGDGSTSTSTTQKFAHIYSTAGTYTVSLTVNGCSGSSIAKKTILATVATAATVTAPLSGGTAGGATNGPVAAYGFEEASGTTVVDVSGQKNNGIMKNGTTRVTKGRFGKGLSFDGVNDRVEVKDASSLDLTTRMTLEAWVYPTAVPSNWRTVIQKEVDRYYLMVDSKARVPAAGGTYTTGNDNLYAPASFPLNTWTHFAATYDGIRIRLYVNGVQVASQPHSAPLTTSTGPLSIGGTARYGEFFQGRIDEVRIYNRALSAAEINSDKNRAVGQ